MKQTFSDEKLAEIYSKLNNPDSSFIPQPSSFRAPVHVVYGGAHLFTAETPQKLGNIALKSLDEYAPNFLEFSKAMWLKGADILPNYEDAVADLAYQFIEREEKLKRENFAAWFALTVYRKTIDKLRREPVEDFRIDFEDGYGFRTDAEEDEHCISASNELAKISKRRILCPRQTCGLEARAPLLLRISHQVFSEGNFQARRSHFGFISHESAGKNERRIAGKFCRYFAEDQTKRRS